MIYADTDFFIALLKDGDWLQEKAIRLYKEHKKDISASTATIIELLLLSKRYRLDPEQILAAVFSIAKEVKGIDASTALLAAHYIKESDLNVFDALHAAYSKGGPIISSDKVFDSIGIPRIPIER